LGAVLGQRADYVTDRHWCFLAPLQAGQAILTGPFAPHPGRRAPPSMLEQQLLKPAPPRLRWAARSGNYPYSLGCSQSRAAAAARAAAGSASAMRPTASLSCAADRNQASYGEGGR